MMAQHREHDAMPLTRRTRDMSSTAKHRAADTSDDDRLMGDVLPMPPRVAGKRVPGENLHPLLRRS